LITFLLGKKCGIMCKSNAVPQQESSAFLAGSSSSSVGQGEPVASEKRNRSPSAASEHASSLINWLVGGASNGARDHPPQGMQVAASLHLKKDKIRRSISRLTARMRVDTTAHVRNQALISSPKRTGASCVSKPVAVEQVLMQSQVHRAQTSVGAATSSSQRGASLAHLSSSDVNGSIKSKHSDISGSIKSKHSPDAVLSLKSSASPVSSSSLPPMPFDSDFLLGLKEQSGVASPQGSTGQGFSPPSIQGRCNQGSRFSSEDSTASIVDYGGLRASKCSALRDRPRDFKGLPSFLHRAKGMDLHSGVA